MKLAKAILHQTVDIILLIVVLYMFISYLINPSQNYSLFLGGVAIYIIAVIIEKTLITLNNERL